MMGSGVQVGEREEREREREYKERALEGGKVERGYMEEGMEGVFSMVSSAGRRGVHRPHE